MTSISVSWPTRKRPSGGEEGGVYASGQGDPFQTGSSRGWSSHCQGRQGIGFGHHFVSVDGEVSVPLSDTVVLYDKLKLPHRIRIGDIPQLLEKLRAVYNNTDPIDLLEILAE